MMMINIIMNLWVIIKFILIGNIPPFAKFETIFSRNPRGNMKETSSPRFYFIRRVDYLLTLAGVFSRLRLFETQLQKYYHLHSCSWSEYIQGLLAITPRYYLKFESKECCGTLIYAEEQAFPWLDSYCILTPSQFFSIGKPEHVICLQIYG